MRKCTQCEHNGKCSNACLSCEDKENYKYKYTNYIIDGYDPKQPDTSGSEKVTDMDEEVEDALRKVLYTLLDLRPNELLLIKAIHDGKTLTQYAKDMEQLAQKNQEFTRFKAYQTRKSIAKRLPKLAAALLTNGQRRPQKKD